LGSWDAEDLEYMVYQLKYDSVHKTFGGFHARWGWEIIQFPGVYRYTQ